MLSRNVLRKFLITLVALSLFPIIVLADGSDVQFLGMPWLSSVVTVKETVASKLTKDLPTGEFERTEWNATSYGETDVRVKDVPIYTLTYEGKYYYSVAGYNVASLITKFVPKAEDGTYSDKNFDDYVFIEATYRFDADSINDCQDIYDGLLKKLSSLYGERTDDYSDNQYETYYTLVAKGSVWKTSNNGFLELRWAKMSSSFTGTMEHVYLTYAFDDVDYITARQEATLDSSGESNLDVGATNGL